VVAIAAAAAVVLQLLVFLIWKRSGLLWKFLLLMRSVIV